MNEEEKKAIELLENIRNNSWTTKYIMSSDSKNAEVLLNLIDKLQKENEELKEDRDKFKKALGKRITYCNELEKDLFENGSNYVIPIQTIKDRIEKLNKKEKEELKGLKGQDRYFVKQIYQYEKKSLQELLEGRK